MIFDAAPLRQRLWWLIPVALCLYFHWPTLGFWFRADDFAWLGLGLSIHDAPGLARALFEPQAQGTARFLSERAFFLIFESLFELNALPYRIAILAALVASCVLLAAIVRRMTRSDVAAALAPSIWIAMAGLSSAIGWLSSSNQIWFGLFFLLAFWCYLDGRMLACWIVFLLGFGTLEAMVMFPFVCLAYAFLVDRTRMRQTFPLLIPSAAFVVLHFAVLGKVNRDPAYLKYFDVRSVFDTASYYLGMAATGEGWSRAGGVAMVLILAVAAWLAWRRDFRVLFGVVWFALMLAPVLPLRDHRMLYYLAAPGMAIGFTLSAAIAIPGRRQWIAMLAAAAAALTFVGPNRQQSRWIQAWHKNRTEETRNLVWGVVAANATHPGAVILLDNISNELFWDAMFDNPFRLLELAPVYLAPGAESRIDSHPEWGGINEWIVPPDAVRKWFAEGKAVTYAWKDGHLTNTTSEWREKAATLRSELSPFVDAGDPAFTEQLGEGWHELEPNRSRWMSGRATVTLNVARAVAREVLVAGYAPGALLREGPVTLTVNIDGREAGRAEITQGDAQFERIFPLGSVAAPSVRIQLEASRTVRVGADARDLSFAFGTVQIR